MTRITHPVAPAGIEYPDDDGEPMADNTLQYKWIVVIEGGLEALFRSDPHVFVAGNLLWYPVEGQPTIRAAPDALVAFDRPKGRRGSYKQWVEGNVAPQVVFEVRSPGNRPGELENKFYFYERYGVQEYYCYDPDDGTLEGWIRASDRLEEIPEMARFVSPRLGIRFEPGAGADNLKIIGPDGEPFMTYAEAIEQRNREHQRAEAERQRAEAERQRAEAERQRAEAERQRAEAERQRADVESQNARAAIDQAQTALQQAQTAEERVLRLAEQLRKLGIEPD
jgi:Uma2 family endonuclease